MRDRPDERFVTKRDWWLTGLIWGAVVASVIDGKFNHAGGFAAAGFLMSAVGIIHSASLHIPEFNGVTLGYLIAAAFLFIYPRFQPEHAEKPESAGEPKVAAEPAD